MKHYILRTLRAIKWFIIGGVSVLGFFCSVTGVMFGKKLFDEYEKKEEEPNGGFERYKVRYHEYKKNDDVELAFH